MVQRLETVAGHDFCLLSSQNIEFIKNQASKLNNSHNVWENNGWDQFHLIVMITNTPAECGNYHLDTHDVNIIKETSHIV